MGSNCRIVPHSSPLDLALAQGYPFLSPPRAGGGQQRPLSLTGDSLSASCSICRTCLTCRVSTETPQHHSNCGTDRNVV